MKHVVSVFTLLAIILLAFSLAQSVAAATIIVSCPFSSSAGDDLTRGFYVTSYPGSNLATVHLEYSSSTAGTYTISLTPRLGAFNGPVIGGTQTVTVSLPSTSSEKDVTFHFGGAAVTPGSTVAFTQVQIAGPGNCLLQCGLRLLFRCCSNRNRRNHPSVGHNTQSRRRSRDFRAHWCVNGLGGHFRFHDSPGSPSGSTRDFHSHAGGAFNFRIVSPKRRHGLHD